MLAQPDLGCWGNSVYTNAGPNQNQAKETYVKQKPKSFIASNLDGLMTGGLTFSCLFLEGSGLVGLVSTFIAVIAPA